MLYRVWGTNQAFSKRHIHVSLLGFLYTLLFCIHASNVFACRILSLPLSYMKLDISHWDSSPTEKSHLQFCKSYLLTINKKARTCNIACLSRVRQIPSHNISIDQWIIIMILITSKDTTESTIVNQAFTISKQSHSHSQNSYYIFITNLVKSQNITIDNILTKRDVNSNVTNAKTAFLKTNSKILLK